MFEINEAFASQAYAVRRDLGLDKDKVNIYGGGISIDIQSVRPDVCLP